jgi:vesicular inhibitory amino acid transporter
MKIQTLRQIGGVNSIDNFAKSLQRAAGYQEVIPIRPSFRFLDGEEGDPAYHKSDVESPPTMRSLLKQAFDGRRSSDIAVEEAVSPGEGPEITEDTSLLNAGPGLGPSRFPRVPPSWSDSIFSVEPTLKSGFGGSYGTMYASRQARPRQPSIMHAAEIFREEQVKDRVEGDTDQDPLLIKQVEEDGVVYNVVVGNSTIYQTTFNSINTLVGIGKSISVA